VGISGADDNCIDQSMILADPLWAEVYAPNGKILKIGDIAYRKVTSIALILRTPS
jgi:hypothetical protein